MAKKKGPTVGKMATKMPRKVATDVGVGNPGTTVYTGKPGLSKGKASKGKM